MEMNKTSNWTPLQTGDGTWTLRAPGHGEACHSRSGAWAESMDRYVRACRIRERARFGSPVRILDVGTGPGWNVAAALRAVSVAGSETSALAALEVTTLERDPSVFDAARRLCAQSPEDDAAQREAKGWQRETLRALACARNAPGCRVPFHPPGRGGLRLLLGDARERISEVEPGPRFDAVFLDPFSRGREPDLWSEDFLRDIARRMAPGSLLSTFSASFSVRLALQRAGLHVGLGPAFGAKREGTLASPDLPLPALSERVTERLAAAWGVDS